MPYFPVDDGFSSHPKVTRLRRGPTRERAIGLWTLAGSWCARNLTDGHVPPMQVEELGCTLAAAEWLVGANLWHAAGHGCKRCPQPEPGGWVFHEWDDVGRNFTRVEVLERRAKKAAAGATGGRKSGESRRGGAKQRRSNDEASASQLVQPHASRLVEPPSHPIPSQPVPSEQVTEASPQSSAIATPPRPDVARLCAQLADAIEANGSKRPRITNAWRTAARLLLDDDGRTEQQVAAAIAWCQADEFWRANVLSMPTLRKQYDRLRLAAIRDRDRASRPRSPGDTALALVANYQPEVS